MSYACLRASLTPGCFSKSAAICRNILLRSRTFSQLQQKGRVRPVLNYVNRCRPQAGSRYLTISPEAWTQRGHAYSKDHVSEEQFTLIYTFPGIRVFRTISRLKLLQTSITFILLPPVYYFYWLGELSQDAAVYSTGIAVFASVMLYSISYYLRRLIGMIYLNEAGTTVKVSHLTFWGKRKDLLLPLEDVMALNETGDHSNEILLKFKQYSSPQVLYFTARFGRIVDKDKFVYVFGRFL